MVSAKAGAPLLMRLRPSDLKGARAAQSTLKNSATAVAESAAIGATAGASTLGSDVALRRHTLSGVGAAAQAFLNSAQCATRVRPSVASSAQGLHPSHPGSQPAQHEATERRSGRVRRRSVRRFPGVVAEPQRVSATRAAMAVPQQWVK